jgi:hypothetical protein
MTDFGERMARIEGNLEGINSRFSSIESRFSSVESRLTNIESGLDSQFKWTIGTILITWVSVMTTILIKL